MTVHGKTPSDLALESYFDEWLIEEVAKLSAPDGEHHDRARGLEKIIAKMQADTPFGAALQLGMSCYVDDTKTGTGAVLAEAAYVGLVGTVGRDFRGEIFTAVAEAG